jgi:predicted Zn-dependent protease
MRLSAYWLLALFALFVGLSGCTVNPATGQTAFTGFMSESEESKIGKENHPKILEEFGGAYANPALQAYVQRIGKSIASHSDRPDIDYQFTVLDSDIVNAFAMPGGYIYITRGLLARWATRPATSPPATWPSVTASPSWRRSPPPALAWPPATRPSVSWRARVPRYI